MSRLVLHPTEKRGEKVAKEVSTGEKRSERKLEEEMKKLGETVLIHPTAPTHPLLGQNLSSV